MVPDTDRSARAAALAALGLLGFAQVATAPREAAVQPPVAIVGVPVVDVAGGAVAPDQTVILDGSRIAAVAPAASVTIPRGARVLDGRGKWLIPGLWDMHAHTAHPATDFPLYIAHGVTGVRDMGGYVPSRPSPVFSVPFDSLRVWRAEVRAGRVLGPRIVAAGVVLDGPEPFPGALGLANARDARRVVDSLARAGVDFIKVTTGMPGEVYRAVADAARRAGVSLAGHVPAGLSAVEVAELGQRSIEHLMGLPTRCVTQGRCADVFETLARRGTWVVPTLVAWRHVLYRDDTAVTRAPALRWASRAARLRWDSTAAAMGAPDSAQARAEFSRFLRLVGEMHAAGLRLLAGTDAAYLYTVPGYAVHQELRWLVAAGLSPAAALRTATLAPAEYLGAADSLGTIEPGKLADLVLLEANPLRDIANASRISAVIVGGRLVDAERRRALLDEVVRHALEEAYDRNRAAMLEEDLEAVMALRTPDFRTVDPSGTNTSRSARPNSAPVWYRSSGVGASALSTVRSTTFGTAGPSRRGVSDVTRLASSRCELEPTNGNSPTSISYTTVPSEYTSLRPSIVSPMACSGAM